MAFAAVCDFATIGIERLILGERGGREIKQPGRYHAAAPPDLGDVGEVEIEALPAEHRFDLDIADIAEVWRRGSVIPSWLLDLTASALARNPTLESYSGYVEDSGEGRWTVTAAVDEAVPAEVLTAALYARFRSRKQHTFAEKILSAMRDGFGGHKEPPQHPAPVPQTAPDTAKPKA
jgi:6-phosphogluconate dehydrogenase